jgi:hypothetical protein
MTEYTIHAVKYRYATFATKAAGARFVIVGKRQARYLWYSRPVPVGAEPNEFENMQLCLNVPKFEESGEGRMLASC